MATRSRRASPSAASPCRRSRGPPEPPRIFSERPRRTLQPAVAESDTCATGTSSSRNPRRRVALYPVKTLVQDQLAKWHGVDKQMAGEAREEFAAFVPDGDVAKFARGLPAGLAGRLVFALDSSFGEYTVLII